jgi:hypothetical protein
MSEVARFSMSLDNSQGDASRKAGSLKRHRPWISLLKVAGSTTLIKRTNVNILQSRLAECNSDMDDMEIRGNLPRQPLPPNDKDGVMACKLHKRMQYSPAYMRMICRNRCVPLLTNRRVA